MHKILLLTFNLIYVMRYLNPQQNRGADAVESIVDQSADCTDCCFIPAEAVWYQPSDQCCGWWLTHTYHQIQRYKGSNANLDDVIVKVGIS